VACGFGPIEDAGDLRGIGVLDVRTLDEAEAIAARDPAVAAGRLRIEIKRWFARPGDAVPRTTAPSVQDQSPEDT
jgi:hypothetical protein